MPDQFTVPQFIDAEDHIFGPLTARQFIILMVAGLLGFGFYKLLSFGKFLTVAIPLLIFAGTLAFYRVNGQAFHYFILNFIQTLKKPKLRVWGKVYTDAQLKEYIHQTSPQPPAPFVRKAQLSTSRLNELALVVNTGGVYKPDD